MKYMHFNSSCSYAGIANLLELRGIDVEDDQIAFDMGLPYFLRYDEQSGAYLNGPMLQSSEWFDLYLKTIGFRYIEHVMGKKEAVEQLCSGSMLGLQVTPESKHAVIFLKKKNGAYVFLNNKWADSEEPDYLLLSEEECLNRLPEQVVVGHLESCEAEVVNIKPYLEEALENWEKLQVELQGFMSKIQTPQAMKEAMNRLLRPLLLDGISMAEVLYKIELKERLIALQKQFLTMLQKNEAVRPSEQMDCEEIDKAINTFISLIKLQIIRESERLSYMDFYSEKELYKEGSWLQKPIQTVTELFPLFEGCEKFRALDLGCGVGRNAIAIAKQFQDVPCRIDCVDILKFAMEKLVENAEQFGVEEAIWGFGCPMEEFEIIPNVYDLILAVSALEHINSKESFVKKLEEMRESIKPQGVVCLVVNSKVREKNKETGEELFPQFEVNLPTQELQEILHRIFAGWEVLKSTVREQQYDIPREECISELSTNVVTYVARKRG
ncbi:MAG: class I SAM-dependent methyltransferase [Lachnospiraceae bacterium]|nr:class I SAM-dependent methyltransferase [Lachnospiraceae bacterium]